jgi:NADH-quinone oxidoreductase subunit N
MKRLLAYSTIAQAGYIFLGLAVMTSVGEKATLFYIFIYTFMNLGAFGAVIAVGNSLKSETMDDYAGLYKRDPLTAVVLAILLLSLAGLPPLAGFLAKFFILAAAIQAKYTVLAIIAVINTVIALFYYVKVIKFMFLREPSPSPYTLSSPVLRSVLVMTAFFNILFGLWPHMVLNWLTTLLGVR